MKLVLTKAWPGPRGTMQPGEYAIPKDITLVFAKCARADGAGNIVAVEVTPAPATFLPEIKEQRATPPATIYPPEPARSSKRRKGSSTP